MTPRADRLVSQLTLAEKCRLLAGDDLWSTVAIERLGIPKIQVTDGPSGARGATIPGDTNAPPSFAAPCAAALGSTFDADLVEQVGAAIGRDARDKACRVLLAPTVNLHRSPLGGRTFECYSEDPYLSGVLASAFVRGAQAQGVACTVKHFVANDAETERYTMSSEVDERTLRELYLVPFEMAVDRGGALGIMTGYNRLNGTWCGEHPWLLRDVLRGEWGFDGFVISDWFAIASAVGGATAGLDLEMPGPPRAYAELEAAVESGELDAAYVDERVRALLGVFDRIGALDDPLTPPAAQGIDRDDDRRLAIRAAAESIVLLRNDGVLPLDETEVRRIALLGPNAQRLQTNGGGSAQVVAHRATTLPDALRDSLPGVELVVEAGAPLDRAIPTIVADLHVEYFADLDLGGDAVRSATCADGALLSWGPPPGLGEQFSLRATGSFAGRVSGPHTLALLQSGRARVMLDGVVVLDGERTPPPPGKEQFGMLSAPLTTTIDLEAGTPHELTVEYRAIDASLLRGARVGLAPPPEDLLEPAVAAARDADAAIVVVGTDKDWESEGHDRADMALPPGHAELARAVIAAQPNTVVVVNAGTIVDVGFATDAPALLHCWFGGQETANALAAVLLGRRDPGGRLPTTIPERLEHTPAYGSFPGENSQVRYGEGLLVGYRWYDSRHLPVRYPFGHGLSYTTFAIGAPRAATTTITAAGPVVVEVDVTNTGARPGHEVVQCYVAPPAESSRFRPAQALAAFAKVTLERGETQTVGLTVEPRAFAYWDPTDVGWAERAERLRRSQPFGGLTAPRRAEPGWYVDGGDHELRIGRSSRDLRHSLVVTAPATFRVA